MVAFVVAQKGERPGEQFQKCWIGEATIIFDLRFQRDFPTRRFQMRIRYGFDIELTFPQPTTVVTVMDVHPSRKFDVIEESGIHTNQEIRFQRFMDHFGNVTRRFTADAGVLALK
jgi:hypothetical protein